MNRDHDTVMINDRDISHVSVGHINVLVVYTGPHKCCCAIALLANQLWCPVSLAEVVLKAFLASKLLSTVLLQTADGLFLEVNQLDVFRQGAGGDKLNTALGIIAHQLLLPMSCRALMDLQFLLASKDLPTVANLALESLFGEVYLSHVLVETIL